jgi:hypothetical protein
MRKLFFAGLIVAGTLLFTAGTSSPASAWCFGGYGYGYASPAWGYRSYYRPYYAGWGWRGLGWRGWGYRSWGWGWGGRRWGWGGRHWGRRRW